MANKRPVALIPYAVCLSLSSALVFCFDVRALEKYNPSDFVVPGKNAVANRLLTAAFLALGKNDMHMGLDRAESAIKLDSTLGQAFLIKGVCLYELDRPRESIDALKRGFLLLPQKGKDVLVRCPSEPAYSRHILAAALTAEGRSAEALAVLKEANQMYPQSCLTGSDLGDYYRSKNQDDLAIKFYSSSIASGFGMARESRSNLYLNRGACDLALADVNVLILKDPENSRLFVLRSKIYKKMGKLVLAEKDLLKANSRSLEQF